MFVVWSFLLSLLGFSRKRRIFRFWDGKHWREADPVEIYRGLMLYTGCNLDKEPSFLDDENEKVALEASRLISLAVREVFKVPEFAAGGLTESECLDLFFNFFEFASDVKKNGNSQPIQQPSTESSSSDQSLTNADSGCSSTQSDSSCVGPGPSTTEPTGAFPQPDHPMPLGAQLPETTTKPST